MTTTDVDEGEADTDDFDKENVNWFCYIGIECSNEWWIIN